MIYKLTLNFLGGLEIIKILDIIYPPMCIVCGRKIGKYLCDKCENQLNKDKYDFLIKYKDEYYFNEHMYLFKYNGIIRKVILDYKFKEKSYIYRVFKNLFKNNKKIYSNLKKYDIIIPVPISRNRFKERGYNQSSLIAKEISRELKKEYKENILIKKKSNVAQSTLNKEERVENVKGVYEVYNGEYINNKRVLIVDDIFTTGSTLNECSKILKESGARKIGVFTIAKD